MQYIYNKECDIVVDVNCLHRETSCPLEMPNTFWYKDSLFSEYVEDNKATLYRMVIDNIGGTVLARIDPPCTALSCRL